ncbi:MAG TPA: NHL repeat-containing protein [Acidobacteriaceae bacterium]
MRCTALAPLCFGLILAGCGSSPTSTTTNTPPPGPGVAIRGSVHSGQQAVSGAHVYLFAANTTGYGNASVSLLNASSAGASDALGAYVTSDSTGSFSIPADYTCTANAQTYLYAAGGNAGAGVNSAIGLLAALGNCPSTTVTTPPTVWINEVSTVAAAYAFSGFAADATHVSSSGTALAQTGIANAFRSASNLANLATGTALSATPAGNGMVPQPAINGLANMLVACTATAGPASAGCSTLFSNTLSGGATGAAPTNTATAAINVAHNPAANVSALIPLENLAPAFFPNFAGTPSSFTLNLAYTYPGINLPYNGSFTIAIDASGNVWIPNNASDSVTELSPTGAILSPNPGYAGGGLKKPIAVAIDPTGSVWLSNTTGPSVSRLSGAGVPMSPATGYTDPALNNPLSLAVDGAGNAWIANDSGASLTKLSPSGTALSPAAGFTGGGMLHPAAIAIDSAGNAWTANISNETVSKFSPTGAALSPAGGFTGGTLFDPIAIAIDGGGNAWIANANGSNTLTELSPTGVPVSPTGFGGGGLSHPISVAIDGAGNVFAANLGAVFSKFSPSGVAISPAFGYLLGPYFLNAIAVDGSGNVWISADTVILESIGAAVPVVTPLSAGVANHTLGARP